MSDENTEIEKKPRSGFLKYLLFLLGGIVFAGIGFGGGYYMFAIEQRSPADEIELIIEQKLRESGQLPAGEQDLAVSETGVTKIAPGSDNQYITTYFEFPEKFTTNLIDSEKFLQLGLSVSTQYDNSVIENITTHSQALRSEVLSVMGGFSVADVQTKSGRDILTETIMEAMNARLIMLEGFGGIEGVYFSSFIIQ